MSKLRDSKTYSINDFLTWNSNKELELSPKFQRNKVWNQSVKSYLIDTILRGMPIPPIFITQKIDLNTQKTLREVIDGQQRLTAITQFKNNEFKISSTHNKELANKTYDDLSDELKVAFLEYEIPVEIIKTETDAVIYDIFARLNTNNITLNKQELRNAKYWGEFKVVINKLALEYKDFFKEIKTFTDTQFSRMLDNEFLASLMILTINGVVADSATSIDGYYKRYDNSFENSEEYLDKFRNCMRFIEELLIGSQFKYFNKKVQFYTLFATVFHIMYRIENIPESQYQNLENVDLGELHVIRQLLLEIESKIERVNDDVLTPEDYKKITTFINLHKTRTTNQKERKDRVEMLINEINTEFNI